MADKALLKAKIDSAKKEAKKWLLEELDPMPRGKLICMIALPMILAYLLG